MADCAKLEQQAQQLADQLSRLTEEGNRTSNLNPTSADVAIELGRSAARILGQINTIKSQLLAVQDQQRDGACPFIGFLPQRRAADAAAANLNSFIDKADQIARTAKQQEEASRQATTSTNNSGTGVPGTAGTGATATPGAAQLEEVQVTAKRKPETLEEVQVTGVKKDTTGLEEVQVTGKRNPDELQEVQVTGKRNPDELQEVQVTGKRAPNTNQGVPAKIRQSQAQATLQDTTNFQQKKDWRVRLSLSPGANYLYKDPDNKLLAPLQITDGILFPYTPSISVSYNASYDAVNPTHSNYKIFQYTNSNVDNVTITCDFTAQDTFEANYLLAVIHFLKSATKMFYGQDENPKPGTPPPLVFLFGLGQFQFNAHPLVITNFSYNLPQDVDYIRAGVATTSPGVSKADSAGQKKPKKFSLGDMLKDIAKTRLETGIIKGINKVLGSNLIPGGGLSAPDFSAPFNTAGGAAMSEPTYIPTKINISITCSPIISRYETSTNFSLKEYSNGNLLLGTKRKGGGFW